MRCLALAALSIMTLSAGAADLESRALTTYVAQDTLEGLVRKEGWLELTLKPYGGVRKGDILRVWAGGVIDRGNGDAPGQNFAAPTGSDARKIGISPANLSLSTNPGHACAILFK